MKNGCYAAGSALRYGWQGIVMLLLFIGFCTGCPTKVSNTVKIPVTEVMLQSKEVHLGIGEATTLVATVLPKNATDKTVTWSSNNDKIAAVDGNGKVTAKSAGSAIITVVSKDGGKKAVCTVTVTQKPVPVTEVMLQSKEVHLGIGEATTLVATVLPEHATDRTVTWSSDNDTIAAVDGNGKVTAKSAGSAAITVTSKDGGKKAVCTVTVTQKPVPVTEVTVKPKALTLTVGATATLVATVLPKNATDKTVTWSSDNDTIAAVDVNGKVTAKSAGSATITVTSKDGGKTTTAIVQVLPFEIKDGKLVKYTGTNADIVLPETVKVIGAGVFKGNKTLKTIKLPVGLLEIEDDAFFGSGLTKISIPASVTKIGGYAFMKSDLTELEFAEGAKTTELPASFCQACEKLTKVTLQEGLQSIGTQAFEDCKRLTEIRLPDSVHTLKTNAFCRTVLQTVILPANLQKLEPQVFYINKNLTTIQASATPHQEKWVTIQDNGISAYCFSNNPVLETIALPNKVTTISTGAFLGASQLKNLILPASIISIAGHIIDVSSIATAVTVHVKGSDPAQIAIGKEPFTNFYDHTKGKLSIRVPKGKVEEFKKADGWKKYAAQISEENGSNN